MRTGTLRADSIGAAEIIAPMRMNGHITLASQVVSSAPLKFMLGPFS
jgi:hypothetical protein